MLQRGEFLNLLENVEEMDDYIWIIYKEYSRFISLSNSIESSEDMIKNIELIKSSEVSVRSLLNLVFIKMNPEINRWIAFDQEKNNNYAKLSSRIEKIIDSIEERRETFIKNLSNKSDIEVNRITNKANLDFFMSFLRSICKDLIFNSLSHAYKSYSNVEKPALQEKQGGELIIYTIKNKDEELYWYLVYLHFSRLSQITVSLFKFIPKELPIRPHEVTDLNRLYLDHPSLKKESNLLSNEQDIQDDDEQDIEEEEEGEDE